MKLGKALTIVLLVVALLALAGCYPVTQSDVPGTLGEFLARLGTSAGIGAAIYFILENLPYVDEAFDGLDPKAKRLVVLGLSFVIPLATLGVGVQLGHYDFTPDAVYQALAAGFEAFCASQVVHTTALRR